MKNIIAPCGLDCGKCMIYLAPYNQRVNHNLVRIFKGMWENVSSKDFHCSTCRGEISECWTTECWIRDCCIKDKNLDFCYQCQDFPCNGLNERASTSKRYSKALKMLKKMKKQEK
ncbi:MAG: DUF3795 domain-containing protein [Promethearchaeota archaeon]